MSKESNDGVAEAAEKIAEAETIKAEGEAEIAGAVADNKKAEASEVIVAAATAVAALAETEAAKAKQEAGEIINKNEGDMSWLRNNQETLANSLSETNQRLSIVAESTGKLTEMVSQLLTPAKQSETQSQEIPIADPKNAGQEGQQEKPKSGKQEKKSPSAQEKKGRLWT